MSDPWWKGAVCYQIYPRSFQDSNGDGVGDLKGITRRLGYLHDLGIEAIWISPFFKSPMTDFGYDISDYRAVDPLFGTLDDFKTLLNAAHDQGMKIIIDLVLSHSSDQHDWFIESRSSADHDKADWYVWEDAKADGGPPNNWHSLFGGPAWTFDTRRGQYYLHNFLKTQPDLNMHNPKVQDAVLDVVRFWLDLGVDGLRLDVVNFYFHDQQLRDNPPRPAEMGAAVQFEKPEPYNMQAHIYDKSRPENLVFLEKLRALMDQYDDRMTLGEIGDDNPNARVAEYTLGNRRLHTAYNLALLAGMRKELTAPFLRDIVEGFFNTAKDSWPSWAFSNHDVVRAPTRWGPDKQEEGNPDTSDPDFSLLLIALLLSLRGTVFLYQGEELGLNDVPIAYEDLQDPWGKVLWPEWQGRDGCRTPMPWDAAQPHMGFSDTSNDKPWLPLGAAHADLNVATQQSDPHSHLSLTQDLIAFRKSQPCLKHGDIQFIDTGHDKTILLRRDHAGETALFACNLSAQAMDITLPMTAKIVKTGRQGCDLDETAKTLTLPAFGFCFAMT